MKNEPEATPVKVDLFELIAELNHEIAEAHTKYGYEHNALVNAAAKIKEAVAELFGTAEEDELCDCNRCETDFEEKCYMCGEACLSCQDKFDEKTPTFQLDYTVRTKYRVFFEAETLDAAKEMALKCATPYALSQNNPEWLGEDSEEWDADNVWPYETETTKE